MGARPGGTSRRPRLGPNVSPLEATTPALTDDFTATRAHFTSPQRRLFIPLTVERCQFYHFNSTGSGVATSRAPRGIIGTRWQALRGSVKPTCQSLSGVAGSFSVLTGRAGQSHGS